MCFYNASCIIHTSDYRKLKSDDNYCSWLIRLLMWWNKCVMLLLVFSVAPVNLLLLNLLKVVAL